MKNGVRLQNLIDVSVLEKMQKSFTEMTGVATFFTDSKGEVVTDDMAMAEFCRNHARCSEMGKRLCSQCNRYSALETLKEGRCLPYYCPNGLIVFAAPIIARGEMIGALVGGQVYVNRPNELQVKMIARELKIDGDELWEAAQKVKLSDYEDIVRDAEFLESLATAISNMANGKLMAELARKDVEKASQSKADFLANMSHEIRTPMNAVMGMAEMALREPLPAAARDYVEQIGSSSKALLNIINDVLDYSKIESGQLTISEEEYDPMTLLRDVSTIIMSRLMQKSVELLIEVSPDMPRTLIGDSQRIRQVLINLANNAVKFTNEGHVFLHIDFDRIDINNINIKVRVEDTGIGIHKEDIGKLFGSFSQVDTTRNRNIEGTGLGLSIVKNLLALMKGSIEVTSEYGKGSVFSFTIPQKVADNTPSIQANEPDKQLLIGFFARKDVEEDFVSDAGKLGLNTVVLSGSENPGADVDRIIDENPGKEIYVVVEQAIFDPKIMELVDVESDRYAHVHAVLLAETFADLRTWKELTYLETIKKPISVINLAAMVNRDDAYLYRNVKTDNKYSFIAPDAHVLLVDDNAINLTVAEGLLSPMHMHIDKALSGKEALEMIEKVHYDLIFMDHMMPGMDGVETTRIIRRFHPECNDIPIIALTANALNGAREMFLSEGMNDFVAKPIELRILEAKVKQWLPFDKVYRATQEEISRFKSEEEASRNHVEIGDIDTDQAISLLGNEKLYWTILKEYYRTIGDKAARIQKAVDDEDWATYTIEVHGLKSASRQIGAMGLADLAAQQEMAGNSHDFAQIKSGTFDMLKRYVAYEEILAPFCKESGSEEAPKILADRETLRELFEKLKNAMDELNLDEMEAVANSLKDYLYSEADQKMIDELQDAVSNIDIDRCEEIINAWE